MEARIRTSSRAVTQGPDGAGTGGSPGEYRGGVALQMGGLYGNGKPLKPSEDRAVRVIQAVLRGHMAARELARASGDKFVVFNRAKLSKDLSRLPLSRRAHCYGVAYTAMFSLILFLSIFLGFTSEDFYKHAGYTKDSVLFGNSDVYSVRTAENFYTMVQENIVNAIDIVDSKYLFLHGAQAMLYDGETGITISQERSHKVACSTIYDNSGLLSYDYNGGYCALGLSAGTDTATYGNTTATAVACSSLDPQNPSHQLYYNGTICPAFTYSQTFTSSGQTCRMPTVSAYTGSVSTRAEMISFLEIMKRCRWIDNYTRRIWVEVPFLVGNKVPLFAWLTIIMDIDTSGDWVVSYTLEPFVVEKKGNSDRSSTVYPLSVLLNVCCCLGLSLILLDFVAGTAFRGLAFAKANLQDAWSLLAVASYIVTMTATFEYFDYTNAMHQLSEKEHIQDLRSIVRTLTAHRRPLQVLYGLAMFLAVIRVLSTFRHRGLVSGFTRAVEVVATPLLHFCAVLGLVLVAFSLLAWAIFGSDVHSYSTILESMETLTLMTFGSFDFTEMKRVHEPIALVFFYTYSIFLSTVLINFFIAIVLDGYTRMISKGSGQMPIWTEFASNLRNAVIMCKVKVTPTDEIIWVLEHCPLLNKRELVNLRDIRRCVRHSFCPEAAEVMCNFLVDHPIPGSNKDPDLLVRRVWEGRYRYLQSSEYDRTTIVLLPGGNTVNLVGWPAHFRVLALNSSRVLRTLLSSRWWHGQDDSSGV